MCPFRIGFTGTQMGLTAYQRAALQAHLGYWQPAAPVIVHHGDCIGADAEAHGLALGLGYAIEIHPPLYRGKRAFCQGATMVHEPKEYLTRNHDIVDVCHILIATPKESEMVLRSGTWATVRYAKKANKTVDIIYPTVPRGEL